MKKMKLNLLEKKEMNDVRGGGEQRQPGPGLPCTCMCHCLQAEGEGVGSASWSISHAVTFYKADSGTVTEPFVTYR